MKGIGEKVRALRTSRGLTQGQLGDMIGVQKAAVQKYESGAVANIKPGVLLNMCDALGVSPSVLMGWRDGSSDDDMDLMDAVGRAHGSDVAAIVDAASQMNARGRSFALQIVSDLALIEKYRRD